VDELAYFVTEQPISMEDKNKTPIQKIKNRKTGGLKGRSVSMLIGPKKMPISAMLPQHEIVNEEDFERTGTTLKPFSSNF
jgi:hypothetical protein